jgi:hypothetical protein
MSANVTEEALQRLRESKAEFETGLRGQGVAAGIAWATGCAAFEDLKRLGSSNVLDDERLPDPNFAAMLVARTARGMPLDSDCGFWMQALNERGLHLPTEPNFVRGFVEGARDVWNVVRKDL